MGNTGIQFTRTATSEPAATETPGELNADLFDKLRALRKKLADERNEPAYFVFDDATLRRMATHMPRDHESFRRIKGVGDAKLRHFSDQFIAVIRDHFGERGPNDEDAVPTGDSVARRQESAACEVPTSATRPRSPVEELLYAVVGRPVVLTAKVAASDGSLRDQVEGVIVTLSDREARVLRLRFGLEDGRARTLGEIGRDLGVTGERIRQIEKKALRKLRQPSRFHKLNDLIQG